MAEAACWIPKSEMLALGIYNSTQVSQSHVHTCVNYLFYLPDVPVKTSPWDGLSDIIAVASTLDVRSKVRVPEVVICPEGVTVTKKSVETFSRY